MIITACVKNREPSFYLKNCSPVALIFKDKGGLANHPVSCHPQGVFGSRESGRKGEKMREREAAGKLPPSTVSIPVEKCESPCTRFDLSLYSAQISKNTKIPSIPIIHEGKNWKNHKREVKRGSTE